MGSLFLFAEVIGDDWPQGLSAFVTGAILGAVVGGILGRGDRFRAGRGARYVSTSLRDVR
jgi:uncharacterized protein YcfJ